MRKKLVFLFLMFAAFSMKKKRKRNDTPNRKLNVSFTAAPLLKKDLWKMIHSDLLPKDEKKFSKIHKSLNKFPTKFTNISKEVNESLGSEERKWRFFEHIETQKIVAENVSECLFFAASVGDLKVVRAVLEAGVDVNAKIKQVQGDSFAYHQFRRSALHAAAFCDRVEIVKELIKAGADLNAVDQNGSAPLHVAAILNHLEVGRLLIDAGADVNIKLVPPLNEGENPLELAEYLGHRKFAKLLRKKMLLNYRSLKNKI